MSFKSLDEAMKAIQIALLEAGQFEAEVGEPVILTPTEEK